MSLPVILRPDAIGDVEEAREYLEAQRIGLGPAFLEGLNEVLDKIGAMPEMFAVVWRNLRAARLRRFMYVVYYRVRTNRVEVLAVMHGSRDASVWRGRV